MIQYVITLPRVCHTGGVKEALDAVTSSSVVPATKELIWWAGRGNYQQAYRYTIAVYEDEHAGKQWARGLIALLTLLQERRVPVTVTEHAIQPVYIKEY